MKEKRNLLTGTGLIGTFALWTVLIQCLDVQAVGQIYVETTILVAIVYCIYLGRIKEDAIKKGERLYSRQWDPY